MRARALLLLLCGVVAADAAQSTDDGATRQPMRPPSAVQPPELRGVLADGTAFSLSELRGRPVVLVFLRGASCGLCLERLRALAAHEAAYDRRDARVVAVTPDPPDRADAVREALELDFPMVSAAHAVLAAWGVWPPGRKQAFPGAFVLDPQGRVRFRHIGRTAADRVSDVILLAALDRFTPAR
ncbi:MAG TPA: peroxiredoxin family protein [Longimicrobiales bacterium]